MKMTGNTILITGGTSGIGRALAEAFHDRGNRVVITGRRQALLNESTAARPGLVGMRLDLDDPASLHLLVGEVGARFPELNVLIANAGISRTENMAANGWQASDAEAIVRTNILGVLHVTAAFLPVLKTRPDAAILATSSALAFVPRTDFPAYCASKAFLHSWLISLRHQLRRIPVEVLELPFIRTARAKGLPWSTILLRHAIRPALLPVVSYLGPAAVGIITGSIVIETVFGLPGIGRFFVSGAFNRDYTLVMGVTLLYGEQVAHDDQRAVQQCHAHD
ncbi:MAG: SDR family NAD(P)-dependent oxidoreductase, partial [Alphaproteobacteria bacterium]